MPYQLLADVVLVLHFAVVLFVVGGLVVVLAGNRRRWAWVNGWRFRSAHLFTLALIVVQTWLGQYCPLTILESWLRRRAGTAPYDRSFIEYWVSRLLYFEAPLLAFALIYTVFGALVAWAWWRFPPRRRA